MNSDDLFLYLNRREFNSFAKEVHFGLENNTLTLQEIGTLFEKMNETYFSCYFSEDEDFFEEYYYISFSSIIDMAEEYIMTEIERHIDKKTIKLDGTVLRKNGESLDIDALKRKLQEQSRKYNEENCFEHTLNNLIQGKKMSTTLQITLLDKFNEDFPFLTMSMVCFIGRFKFNSIDALRDIERVNSEDYTKAQLIELHARSIHSLFCYCFLERASSNEIADVVSFIEKLEKVTTVKEFVLYATTIDFLLCKEAPLFPYTTYLLLTDEEYTIDFLNS